MSDYTITTDFSVKDALPVDDPEKLVLGSDLDVELDALQVAVNSKYDSSDIATEAQAIAGTSNEVLMTPLRVQSLITGGSGGGILGLTDPGADRIPFWDDSANTYEWLTVGTGLTITATTIAATPSAIDHDALQNFVADEHVAHSGVIPTAGDGLALTLSGTGIEAAFDYALDLSGLTEETTIDAANDVIAFYDASAAAHRKVAIDAIVGDELGDGNWYRNATQSIGVTQSTIIFNTERYDSLTRGTYSTSTGIYTAGSEGARILIHAHAQIEGQAPGEDASMRVRVNGSNRGTRLKTNRGKYGLSSSSIEYTMVLSLAAGDEVDVRIENDGTKNIAATSTWLDIVELG